MIGYGDTGPQRFTFTFIYTKSTDTTKVVSHKLRFSLHCVVFVQLRLAEVDTSAEAVPASSETKIYL